MRSRSKKKLFLKRNKKISRFTNSTLYAGPGQGAGAGRGAGGAEAAPGIESKDFILSLEQALLTPYCQLIVSSCSYSCASGGIGVTRETERGRDRGRAAEAAEDGKSYILALFYSVPAFLLNLNVVFKQLCSNFTFGNNCPRFFVNFTGLLKSFHFEQG